MMGGVDLLDTLQKVFQYAVKLPGKGNRATRSMWCNEKVHSILHGSRNIRQVGRSKNITCQVTESRHKTVKAKGHMTNRNPATYGLSILNAEARDSAAQLMAQDADALGMHPNPSKSIHVNML